MWPAFVPSDPAGPAVLAVWALTPYEALLTPPKANPSLSARMSLTAPAGIRVGQVVNLFGLGNLLWPGGPPAATLALLGTARVVVDGGPLETDPGFRLPFVTWLVVRAQGP